MSTLHLRYMLLSALAASVASVVGVAIYVAIEEPDAMLVGIGFGLSLAPYGAVLALPAGLLLGLLRSRISRAMFMAIATTVAMVLGAAFGFWITAGSHILFQPISAFLAFTWGMAAAALAPLSSTIRPHQSSAP